MNDTVQPIREVDEDEHAKQDEERKRDKVQGLVFLFFFVLVGEACFYVKEEGDDSYDSIADTGDNVKDEQHFRYVLWMRTPLR